MNANVVVPIVVGLLAAFGGTGLAALFMIPKQKQAIDASATYQLTQSIVLASRELEDLRKEIRTVTAELTSATAELTRERTLRLVYEERLKAWGSRGAAPYPPPPAAGDDPDRGRFE